MTTGLPATIGTEVGSTLQPKQKQ